MLTTNQILILRNITIRKTIAFSSFRPASIPIENTVAGPGSRERYREANGITPEQFLLLQVGSDFSRKGSAAQLLLLPHCLRLSVVKPSSLLLVRINRAHSLRRQKEWV